MSAVKSWFVNTEFGVRLGPMPDDVLRELVRTGALLRADQVCEASENGWRSASEVPGLFAADSSPTTMTENADSEVGELAESVVATPEVGPIAAFPIVAEHLIPSEPSVKEAPTNAPPELDLISQWKLECSRATKQLGLVSLAAEVADSPVEDDLAPELVAELLDDESEFSPTFVTPTHTTTPSSIQRLDLLHQTNGIAAETQPSAETARQRWNRWQRSMPSWPVAAAIVVVMLATWWLWPRSHRGTYDRYVALWSEWKTRRSDLKDQRGWEQFVQHAEVELNDIVPRLEKSASSTDHEALLLLFIGRDCLQKMLNHPRAIGSRQERQLESLLAQARGFYEPSAAPQPREAFIGAQSSPHPNAVTPSAPTKNSLGIAVSPESPPIAVPPPSNLSSPK